MSAGPELAQNLAVAELGLASRCTEEEQVEQLDAWSSFNVRSGR
jgi:hypothetical protein